LSDSVSAIADTSQSTDGGFVSRIHHPLWRAALVSGVASIGMTVLYLGLAGTTIALGAQALADIAVLELVVGSVFIIAGGAMAAGWTVDHSIVRLPKRRQSVGGFFVFGVLYAGAAAGCTAPLFIAIVLRGIAAGPALGVGLALSYAVGMSAVLVLLTVLSAVGGSSIASTIGRYTREIYRVAGVLLVLSGATEIYYYFYGFPEVGLQ
jgi:cytochrome c-type biogenesis protein